MNPKYMSSDEFDAWFVDWELAKWAASNSSEFAEVLELSTFEEE